MPREPWSEAVDLVADRPIPRKRPAHGQGSDEWPSSDPSECFPGGTQAPSLNNPDLLARLHFDRAVKTPL